jgi:hypothetical protein
MRLDGYTAWYFSISYGRASDDGYSDKDYTHTVRAVRAF